MALANDTRIEIDIIVREYVINYIDLNGNKIDDPREELKTITKQNNFNSLLGAIKYLALRA